MALLEKVAGFLIFTGGKHAGRSLEDVARAHPGYLRWLRNDGPAEHLSDQVFEELDHVMKEFNIPITKSRK